MTLTTPLTSHFRRHQPNQALRVLVADDELTSRLIATKLIAGFGYHVITADDGYQAWQALNKDDPPRLAVLDWMMPGYSGPELCRRLSTRDDRPFIYTILLTSRDDPTDLVDGLESGAFDFLTKPANAQELRLHLRNGSRLVEADDTIRAYAAKMDHIARERARQLVHADRLASLGSLSAGIAHEINNPVGFIAGNLQTLRLLWQDIAAALDGQPLAPDKRAFIDTEMPALLDGIAEGVTRVDSIVQGLKDYARRPDNDQRSLLNLNRCIDTALRLCHNTLKHHIAITREGLEPLPAIYAHAQQIEQVLVNLINNAAQAIGPRAGQIALSTDCVARQLRLIIDDDGPGCPIDVRPRIFDPFFTTKPVGQGTGLGLAVSASIMNDHDGSIAVASSPLGGARFILHFPLADSPGAAP